MKGRLPRGLGIVLIVLCSSIAVSSIFVSALPRFAEHEQRAPGTSSVTRARVRMTPQVDPANYRSRFTADNFGPEKADEARSEFDVDLAFPDEAMGGEYEGVWMGPRSPDGYGEGFVIVYSNDVKVSITRWLTASDARVFLATFTSDLGQEYDPYVKEVRVGGNPAHAVSRVDVAPVPIDDVDPATGLGRIQSGTGLHIVESMIAWSQGRFVIVVSSASHSPDELLEVAEELQVRPNHPDSDESQGYWDKPQE